jgi:hypothetical protein
LAGSGGRDGDKSAKTISILLKGVAMEAEFWDSDAVLWVASTLVAEGPFVQCIKNWNAMPQGPRAKAYIQIRQPIGQKATYRTHDLYGLAYNMGLGG